MERRLQKDPNLKEGYQQSIDADVEKGFLKILNKSDVRSTFGMEYFFIALYNTKPQQTKLVKFVVFATLQKSTKKYA